MAAPTQTRPDSPDPVTPESTGGRPRGPLTAPRVFVPAAILLLAFVVIAAVFSGQLQEALVAANTSVVTDLGWYYVLVVTGFVAFALWLALSPMGSITLGKDDEEPEFGLRSWFAMLFAAGMGIGLVFWGVAEPLNHFSSPPPGTTGDVATIARTAFDVTFLHWGLHAWAIYVVAGLGIAYVVHRRNRPISIRWALEPLFGDRVKGWVGDVIDVVAIVGTVFGVATSLGFGVSQVGAGLDFLGVVGSVGDGLLVFLVIAIMGIALISVVTGVDRGIRWLSNINMVMAGVLALAVLVLGPTVFLLSDFVQQIGSYLQNFLRMSFNTYAFRGEEGDAFLSSWTTYYWGWWMSWAPFVGVFIARISRGRTVREFVLGVLLVPTLVTMLWFSIMGGTAIHREIFGGGGLIGDEGVDTNNALFQMLDALPLGPVLCVIALFLIVVFFVTSADSGSFVVGMLSSGGDTDPPVMVRAFWASVIGGITIVLLLAGGLEALQTMAILVAAPFSVVLVLIAVATAKALLAENRVYARRRRALLVEQVADRVTEDLADQAPSETPKGAGFRAGSTSLPPR